MQRLRINTPIWLARDSAHRRVRFPTLTADLDVDIAIVGGGITGAALAWRFADAGIRVALVEAKLIGRGSTAASTALLQLARTAATEWATLGVRVNAIGPGVVETPLTAQIKNNQAWYDAYAAKSPMQRWAQPGEMVGPTLFLLSDAASYVTGTIVYVDGGWTAADGRFTPPGM